MPATHLSLQYHLVFSTKDRFPFIARRWRDDLHRFIGAALKQLEAVPLEVNGTADHVHVLTGLRSTHRLSDVVMDMKRASSRWVHEQARVTKFAWQEGYGAFTISEADAPAVRRYITEQEAHHRGRNFQDEYRALLEAHHVRFDERYLW